MVSVKKFKSYINTQQLSKITLKPNLIWVTLISAQVLQPFQRGEGSGQEKLKSQNLLFHNQTFELGQSLNISASYGKLPRENKTYFQ